MNALTESAEPILKEVGPAGTLERILELLQNRFGNKANFEKVHADLQNRRRGCNESLQDLYLDLCRLRALASSNASDEKFPEKYFRNIFVDALNDREFRRDVFGPESWNHGRSISSRNSIRSDRCLGDTGLMLVVN